MRHILVPISGLLMSLVISSSAFCDSGNSARAIVGWDRGRLSVDAEKVPLVRLLREVARKSGINVHGAEKLGQEVNENFQNLPLEEGLFRLAA